MFVSCDKDIVLNSQLTQPKANNLHSKVSHPPAQRQRPVDNNQVRYKSNICH